MTVGGMWGMEGRNACFRRGRSGVHTPQGLPDGITLLLSLDFDPAVSSLYCIFGYQYSLLEYFRPSGSKGQFPQPIPRCYEKDLSHVGDRTNISRSTAVLLVISVAAELS